MLRYCYQLTVVLLFCVTLTACDGGADKVSRDSSTTPAAGGSGDEAPPAILSESAERGKALYESVAQGCVGCHGLDAQSDTFKLIDLTAIDYVSTETGVSYPAVQYLEEFMRPSNPSTCIGQCAVDIVAYLNFLGTNGAADPGEGEFEAESLPPVASSVLVPSRIEAENFNRFSDSTETNLGGGEGAVDTEITGDDDGGLNVAFVTEDEWLEYDIYSETASAVNITLRLASTLDERRVALSLDGTELEVLFAPNTGSWQEYTHLTFPNISLTADENHVLRVDFVDGGVNFNYFEVAALVALPVSADALRDIGETLRVASPLASLTNKEYVNSVRSVFDLASDSPNVEAATTLLTAESVVSGLTSDSSAQSFSTSAFNGYLAVATAAVDDFLSDADSLELVRERMQCDELQVDFGRQDRNPYESLVCFRDFARSLFTQVYGSPWDRDPEHFFEFKEDVEVFVEDANLDSESFEAMRLRLRSMAAYMLLDPEFLLFVEQRDDAEVTTSSRLDSSEIAKRMAFFLTASLPDSELALAAQEGSLTDPSVRLLHTNRLLDNALVNDQFAEFFVGWLGVSTSADQVEQQDVDLLRGWLATWFAGGQPFSALYSGTVAVENFDGTQSPMKLGALGTRAFVASHTNNPVPSFINRGSFIVSQLLCGQLPNDIPSAAFEDASTVSETPRELYHELKTQNCATCHHVADNYGALFQQFDQETSLFNATSLTYGNNFDLFRLEDVQGEVSSVEQLGLTLGSSDTAARCTSKLLYRHSLRRNVDSLGADDAEINTIFNAWMTSGDTSIKSLIRTIVVSEHFTTFYE